MEHLAKYDSQADPDATRDPNPMQGSDPNRMEGSGPSHQTLCFWFGTQSGCELTEPLEHLFGHRSRKASPTPPAPGALESGRRDRGPLVIMALQGVGEVLRSARSSTGRKLVHGGGSGLSLSGR